MCVRTLTIFAVYIIEYSLVWTAQPFPPGVNSCVCRLQRRFQRLPLENAMVGVCRCIELVCHMQGSAALSLLVLNHLKERKLKCSPLELGSKLVFNLCILWMTLLRQATWKHVDFESSQLSSLSNLTAPNMHTCEQAGQRPSCQVKMDSLDIFVITNSSAYEGIKRFKVVYCHFKFRLRKNDVFGVGLSSLEESKVTASPNIVPAISHMYIV